MNRLQIFPGISLLIIGLLLNGCSSPKTGEEKTDVQSMNYATIGTIERYDATVDQLIPPDAGIEILAN